MPSNAVLQQRQGTWTADTDMSSSHIDVTSHLVGSGDCTTLRARLNLDNLDTKQAPEDENLQSPNGGESDGEVLPISIVCANLQQAQIANVIPPIVRIERQILDLNCLCRAILAQHPLGIGIQGRLADILLHDCTVSTKTSV